MDGDRGSPDGLLTPPDVARFDELIGHVIASDGQDGLVSLLQKCRTARGAIAKVASCPTARCVLEARHALAHHEQLELVGQLYDVASSSAAGAGCIETSVQLHSNSSDLLADLEIEGLDLCHRQSTHEHDDVKITVERPSCPMSIRGGAERLRVHHPSASRTTTGRPDAYLATTSSAADDALGFGFTVEHQPGAELFDVPVISDDGPLLPKMAATMPQISAEDLIRSFSEACGEYDFLEEVRATACDETALPPLDANAVVDSEMDTPFQSEAKPTTPITRPRRRTRVSLAKVASVAATPAPPQHAPRASQLPASEKYAQERRMGSAAPTKRQPTPDVQPEPTRPISSRNNPSGFKGVYAARNGRWQAQVEHKSIGGFPTAWDAGIAVAKAIARKTLTATNKASKASIKESKKKKKHTS